MEKDIDEKGSALKTLLVKFEQAMVEKDNKIKELEADKPKLDDPLQDPNAVDSKKIKHLEQQLKARNEELEVIRLIENKKKSNDFAEQVNGVREYLADFKKKLPEAKKTDQKIPEVKRQGTIFSFLSTIVISLFLTSLGRKKTEYHRYKRLKK
jgi:hypothetical protein